MPPTSPLEALRGELIALKDAIVGTLKEPGLLQEVREANRIAKENSDLLKDHDARLSALEGAGGKKALDLWERIGLIAAGVALTAASHLALAGLKQAQAQPAPQLHGSPQR